ncbi:substrate-binding periplasmic protein [Vreelandella neptunia]|uniref:Transporter substrate-binding domain-containing protein n=1 Tax=Vreelandella neptunia TaxID=115551 RepID=A0ABS9S8W3_9GAMM|nr:transporter substrate-binding domain-containing protein [Halomonas neptunia]MCH4812534.1 transporter substrate-binding domain-containing protein [Halomonas neptunia]
MANDVTRQWRYRMGVALLTAMGSCSLPLQAMPLTINTEDYPPFNYADDQGQIIGSATELLRNALRQADIEAYFRILPWARAFTEARLRQQHCVYSTTRTQERETLFQWVGPLVVNEWAAFSLAGRDLGIASLQGLGELRVGGFREDAVGDHVASQGINIVRAPSERENIARLKAGLLDVIVTGKATGEFMAEEQNIALEHLFTFSSAPLYLACHPSVSETLLARLQTQLDALHQDMQGESQ